MAVPAAALQVELRVELAGEPPEAAIPVELVLSPAGGAVTAETEPPQPITVESETGRLAQVDLRDDVVWRASAKAVGYWSPQAVIAPGGEGDAIVIELFAEGKLEAPIELARFGELPETITVGFEPAPNERQPARKPPDQPKGTVTCAVVKRRARCVMPVGRLDLRFSAGTFAPVYRPGVQVEARESQQLEPVTLIQGASVAGFVETVDGLPAPKGTRVRLEIPPPRRSPDPIIAYRLDALSNETQVDDRGFFQFAGVRPGQYRVVAEAIGFAPARIEPIEAREDLESSLTEPLVLAHPVTLALRLSPAQDPWGEPWTVVAARIEEASDLTVETFEQEASPSGSWVETNVPPGVYEVVVGGSEGTWWTRQRVEAGEGAAPTQIDIPLIELEGTLLKGSEPAPGRLWFGTSHGERRIVIDVDDEGNFRGLLPGPGEWPLEWQPRDAGAPEVSLASIDVPDRSRVNLDLEVPDTLIEGDVSDEQGNPVASAAVAITSLERSVGPSRIDTDRKGRFALPGLAPGSYGVDAHTETASSGMVHVQVSEDLDPGMLHLVVREARSIAGRVQSAGVGIPGAHVIAWPDLGGSPGVSLVETISGPDGAFTLQVSARTDALNFLVSAPDYGVRLARLAIAPDARTEVELDPYAGTLSIDGLGEGSGSPLLVHDGGFLPVEALARFLPPGSLTSGAGGVLSFQGLSSGLYAICVGANALSTLRNSEVPPETGCTSGWLPPLGELSLQPPGRKR